MNNNLESSYVRITDEALTKFKKNYGNTMTVITSVGFRKGDTQLGREVTKDANEEYLIKYCISGSAKFYIDYMCHNISAGDLIICKKNTKHGYTSDNIDPWSAYWIYFLMPNRWSKVLSNLNNSFIKTNIGHDILLINYFKSINEMMHKGIGLPYMMHSSNLLNCLLSYLDIKSLEENISKNNSKMSTINDVIQFMTNNLNKSFSIDYLSELVGYSKGHFIRIFKEYIGYPPNEYFTNLKIQKACEWISHDTYSYKEIAIRLGYNDYYYFSRIFKDKTGLSPRNYMKKNV